MPDPDNLSWNALWFNARLATMNSNIDLPPTTGLENLAINESYGLIEDGAVGIKGDKIVWVGKSANIPPKAITPHTVQVDCSARLVTPGLIDCHTHLIYAGNRANEFEMRLNGASYQEIASAGGGINATVKATRAATETELFETACVRLNGFLEEGVTTVEIKSGYGLNLETELAMLRVARHIGERAAVNVVTSFLGAHSLPPEYKGRKDDYVGFICETVLPVVVNEGLADAVDAFCEGIAFSPQQVSRVFDAAQQHQLPIKLHAEQLSDQKGAVLAAARGALSVDHIEYLDDQDVAVIAKNGTVAVLLPGAFFCLGETRLPPVNALRQHQVPIAIASDSNPGSSPVRSLLLMLGMACNLFGLTPLEALLGVTKNAAKALGLDNRLGTIEVGKQADLVLWNLSEPSELSYYLGGNPCDRVFHQGVERV